MRTLLTNCHLIPCTEAGPTLIEDAAVVIEGNRIRAADRRTALEPLLRDLDTAADVRRHDLGGRYLMPGLMNMHVHLSLALPGPTRAAAALETDQELALRAFRNARDALQAGITSLRTVGDARYVDFTLKRAINAGQLEGPRLKCAGRAVIVTGGHGFGSDGCVEADGADGFRQAARAQLRAGADHIKLCITGGIAGEHEQIRDSQATFEEMQAACEVAHNAGRPITAHAGSPRAITEGIRAGLDCIEHGYFLDEPTVELMVQRGTYLVPTLCVSRAEFYMRNIGVPQWMIDKSLRAGEDHLHAFQLALGAGVKIAMGTDMLPAEPNEGTVATYREMEFMVEDGGMRTDHALRSATALAADLMGVADDLGVATAGKLADLIAMPANPLESIRALRGIDWVMKDGALVRG